MTRRVLAALLVAAVVVAVCGALLYGYTAARGPVPPGPHWDKYPEASAQPCVPGDIATGWDVRCPTGVPTG